MVLHFEISLQISDGHVCLFDFASKTKLAF